MNKYFKEIITVLVLIVLYATNPAKPIHLSAVYEKLDFLKDNPSNVSPEFLSRISSAKFDVESYIFFSKTTCQIKDNYNVIGIGLLGHIYFIVDIRNFLNSSDTYEVSSTQTEEVTATEEMPAIEATPTY